MTFTKPDGSNGLIDETVMGEPTLSVAQGHIEIEYILVNEAGQYLHLDDQGKYQITTDEGLAHQVDIESYSYNGSTSLKVVAAGSLYENVGPQNVPAGYVLYTEPAELHNVTLTPSDSYELLTYKIVEISSYDVTYKANGGTGDDVVEPQGKNTTPVVSAFPATFTAPDGKYFTGWNTKADGTGTSYVPNGTTTLPAMTADVVLYAQYDDLSTMEFSSEISALGYNEFYDGIAHDALTAVPEVKDGNKVLNPTLTYSITSATEGFSATMPTVTNVEDTTTVWIKAELAGYAPVVASVQATVKAIELSVNAVAPTAITYGDATPDVSNSFALDTTNVIASEKDADGKVNNGIITMGTATVTTDYDSNTPAKRVAGDYAVDISAISGFSSAHGNYTFKVGSDATLTVNKAVLTLTADTPQTMAAGTTEVVTYTASGLKYETDATPDTQASVKTEIGNSPAPFVVDGNTAVSGTYDIIKNTAFTKDQITNYTLNLVGAVDGMEVTPNSYSITYYSGDENDADTESEIDTADWDQTKTAIAKPADFAIPANSFFSGWNTMLDGSGTAYAVGADLPVNVNTVLYAQFTSFDDADVGITGTAYTGIYDGILHDSLSNLVVKNGDDELAATFEYSSSQNGSYSATMPEVEVAGQTTVWVKATVDGYAPIYESFTTDISKAPLLLVPQGGDIAYTSTPTVDYTFGQDNNGVTIKGLQTGDTITAIKAEIATLVNPVFELENWSNAPGTYKVITTAAYNALASKEIANYTLEVSQDEVNVEVNPIGEATLTATAYSGEYDGIAHNAIENHYPVFTVNGEVLDATEVAKLNIKYTYGTEDTPDAVFTDTLTVTNVSDSTTVVVQMEVEGFNTVRYSSSTGGLLYAEVTPADLPVNVSAAGTINYGGALPAFTSFIDANDLQGTDTLADVPVTGTANYSTNYDTTDVNNRNVGTYPVSIDVTNLSTTNTNYTLVNGDGTDLVVNKAELTLTPDVNQSITAGETPVITYSMATLVYDDGDVFDEETIVRNEIAAGNIAPFILDGFATNPNLTSYDIIPNPSFTGLPAFNVLTNYYVVLEDGEFTFEIEPIEGGANLSVATLNGTYTGQSQNIITSLTPSFVDANDNPVTVDPSDITYTYYRGDSATLPADAVFTATADTSVTNVDPAKDVYVWVKMSVAGNAYGDVISGPHQGVLAPVTLPVDAVDHANLTYGDSIPNNFTFSVDTTNVVAVDRVGNTLTGAVESGVLTNGTATFTTDYRDAIVGSANAGNYNIAITGLNGFSSANGNYDFEIGSAAGFEVEKAELTLTPDASQSSIYGQTPVIAYSVAQLQNGDLEANIKTEIETVGANLVAPFVVDGWTATSLPGTYTIAQNSSFTKTEITNYELKFATDEVTFEVETLGTASLQVTTYNGEYDGNAHDAITSFTPSFIVNGTALTQDQIDALNIEYSFSNANVYPLQFTNELKLTDVTDTTRVIVKMVVPGFETVILGADTESQLQATVYAKNVPVDVNAHTVTYGFEVPVNYAFGGFTVDESAIVAADKTNGVVNQGVYDITNAAPVFTTTYNTAAAATRAALGDYDIALSSITGIRSDNNNYNFVPGDTAKLTVNRETLLLTPNANQNADFGSTPVITYSLSGLVTAYNEETAVRGEITANNQVPFVLDNWTATSAYGSYDIVKNSAFTNDPITNYDLTFADGDYTYEINRVAYDATLAVDMYGEVYDSLAHDSIESHTPSFTAADGTTPVDAAAVGTITYTYATSQNGTYTSSIPEATNVSDNSNEVWIKMSAPGFGEKVFGPYHTAITAITLPVNVANDINLIYGDSIPSQTDYSFVVDTTNMVDSEKASYSTLITEGTPSYATTYNTAVEASRGVGNYLISITSLGNGFESANDNYDFAIGAQSQADVEGSSKYVKVSAKTLYPYLTDDINLTYGDDSPANTDYGFDIFGLEYNETLADVVADANTARPVFSTTYRNPDVEANRNVGNYPISIENLGTLVSTNANYVFENDSNIAQEMQDGIKNVIVGQKELPVNVANYTNEVLYGDAIPTDFAYEIDETNLEYSETLANVVTMGTAVFSTNYRTPDVAANRNVGTYDITIDSIAGFSADNYSFVIGNGNTFEVSEATITVTPVVPTMVYGEAVPTIGYSLANVQYSEDSAVRTNIGNAFVADGLTSTSGAGNYRVIKDANAPTTLPNYILVYSEDELDVEGSLIVEPSEGASLAVTMYNGVYDSLTYDAVQSFAPSFVNSQGETLTVNPADISYEFSTNGVDFTDSLQVTNVADSTRVWVRMTAKNFYPVTIGGDDSAPLLTNITPASVPVTANPAIYTFGQEFPTLSVTVGALQGNEQFVDLGVALDLTTTATAASLPGEGELANGNYAITLTGPQTQGNYTFTYTGNELQVIENGTLAVAATPYAAVYDAAAHDAVTAITSSVPGATYQYSIDGGATFAAEMPQFTAAGTYNVTVRASADGYTDADAIVPVVITQAPLVITPAGQTMVYGNDTGLPALTFGIGGLQGADTLASAGVTVTLATTATAGSGVASYAITATGVAATENYTVTYIPSLMTITPKPITLTIDSFTKVEGEADPDFTSTLEGIEDGDTLDYTVVREDDSEDVGTYALTATITPNANYTVAVTDGTLDITAAEVVIEEDDVPLAPEPETPEEEPTVEIEDEEAPLAAAPDQWALLNLILMIAAILMSLTLLIGYFVGKKNDEENVDVKKKGIFRLLSLIPALGAVIAFFLTENMLNPMTIVDEWTLLMVAIAVVQVVVVIVSRKTEKDEEQHTAN